MSIPPPPSSPTILFSAGESSGDQHAASMFLELQKLYPGVKGIGMGGTQMAQTGITLHYDSRSIAVIGAIEVIRYYAEIRRALAIMQQLLVSERPDLLICVDYKEFNLKLASYAKRLGIKVLFYVSPQVWAWRPGRVKSYGKVIDMMAVIFPFETAYYQAEQIPVRYVGHPSVDKVKIVGSKEENLDFFGLDKSKPIIGLLPGSRVNEIKRLLPVMLQAADMLQIQSPGCQFVLPQADSISDNLLATYLSSRPSIAVIVIKDHPYEVMHCCDAVMTCSGTVTLELALLKIPMVIAYKLSAITYQLGKWLVKTPFIGLPNIIAGSSIVKEFIQYEATAKNLSDEILQLITDTTYANQMRNNLDRVKQQLGTGGGSKNMANLVLEMLTTK